MKAYFLATMAIFCCCFATACLNEECRDCDAFNYDAATFNPDFSENDFSLVDSSGQSFTFEYLRTITTPEQRTCSGQVDSEDEITCITSSVAAFRATELGFDLLIGFEEEDRFTAGSTDPVIMSYEVKAPDATQFIRTAVLIVEPELVFAEGIVEERDSVILLGQTYFDVIEIIRPATDFEGLGDFLPTNAQLTNVYIKEGVGLVGIRNVDGNVLARP